MKNFKPYYAVIFTSTQTEDINGYTEMAQKMEDLAKQQKVLWVWIVQETLRLRSV